MAIRLRHVEGELIAICAARSVEKPGDVYLDDEAHHALSLKFQHDFEEEECGRAFPHEHTSLVDQEESSNAGRSWWDKTFAA